jgi:hypothetical protein
LCKADKDQRWTITHKAEGIATPAGTLIIGNSRSAADSYQMAGTCPPPSSPMRTGRSVRRAAVTVPKIVTSISRKDVAGQRG